MEYLAVLSRQLLTVLQVMELHPRTKLEQHQEGNQPKRD
jgi:hypothetical protein